MRSLTDEQVKQARELYETGKFTKKAIGEMFNVSITTIALWLPIDNSKRLVKFNSYTLNNKLCKKCNEPLITHKRCEHCTILLHDNICDCL